MPGRLTLGQLTKLATEQQLASSTEIVILDTAGDEIDLPNDVTFEIDETADEPQIYVSLGHDVRDTSERTSVPSMFNTDDDEEDEPNHDIVTIQIASEYKGRTKVEYI